MRHLKALHCLCHANMPCRINACLQTFNLRIFLGRDAIKGARQRLVALTLLRLCCKVLGTWGLALVDFAVSICHCLKHGLAFLHLQNPLMSKDLRLCPKFNLLRSKLLSQLPCCHDRRDLDTARCTVVVKTKVARCHPCTCAVIGDSLEPPPALVPKGNLILSAK